MRTCSTTKMSQVVVELLAASLGDRCPRLTPAQAMAFGLAQFVDAALAPGLGIPRVRLSRRGADDDVVAGMRPDRDAETADAEKQREIAAGQGAEEEHEAV